MNEKSNRSSVYSDLQSKQKLPPINSVLHGAKQKESDRHAVRNRKQEDLDYCFKLHQELVNFITEEKRRILESTNLKLDSSATGNLSSNARRENKRSQKLNNLIDRALKKIDSRDDIDQQDHDKDGALLREFSDSSESRRVERKVIQLASSRLVNMHVHAQD